MDPISWKITPVIDAHSHYRGQEPIAHYLENVDMANHTKGVILTWRGDPVETGEGDSIYRFTREFKAGHPGRFYIFGGLAHDPRQVAKGDGWYLAPQVANLIAHGFDGIKMMEGSPYFKKMLPHPLDDEYYRPFWCVAEEQAMPITIHLANPVDCWWGDDVRSRETYRDAEPQEEYFRQAEAVLAAHPRLRIAFAHLAMGQEYMYYLSDDPVAARRFFIQWQDRILYGTDVSDANSVKLARAKAEQVRLFLEVDGVFQSPYALASGKPEMAGSNGRVELQGLNLPVDVLRKILGGNAATWLGPTPRPLPVS
jgi:predicted TIM-barrel fold metal-dependent hydrolase